MEQCAKYPFGCSASYTEISTNFLSCQPEMAGYTSSDWSDERLVDLIRLEGDRAAFAELYERYWQLIFVHAHKMLRDEDESMDVVQDCFEKLWAQRHTVQINSSLKAYLYAMARNQTLNAMDKSKRRNQHIEAFAQHLDSTRAVTDEDYRFRELAQRLDAEIAHLPPRMRRIFELSRLEGRSQKEIAAELDISENTVKTVLGRALKVLKNRLMGFLLTFF